MDLMKSLLRWQRNGGSSTAVDWPEDQVACPSGEERHNERMTLLVTKYAVTAFVIVLVSELAKRSDRLGALVSSLPFVTIMVLVWLHLEKQGTEKLSNHAFYTFWYVIPTMPMFLLMPWLLHKGVGFWWALWWCALLTFVCFVATALVAKRFGVELFP
jgi:hypothetical protein